MRAERAHAPVERARAAVEQLEIAAGVRELRPRERREDELLREAQQVERGAALLRIAGPERRPFLGEHQHALGLGARVGIAQASAHRIRQAGVLERQVLGAVHREIGIELRRRGRMSGSANGSSHSRVSITWLSASQKRRPSAYGMVRSFNPSPDHQRSTIAPVSAAEPIPELRGQPGPAPATAVRFDGWRVVGVMFAAQALTVGVTGYAYSLFLKPIGEEFGIDPARLGLGQSGLMFAMMLVGPLLGVALDRYSIRALVIAGAVTFAAGLALLAAASSLVWMAVAYCLIIGVGSLLAGPVSANKLVVSWFMRMRGRALGVSSVGTSAGGVLLPILCAWSIGSSAGAVR